MHELIISVNELIIPMNELKVNKLIVPVWFLLPYDIFRQMHCQFQGSLDLF